MAKEIISAEIKHVFESLNEGSRTSYDVLVTELKKNNVSGNIPDGTLLQYLEGLHPYIVQLTRDYYDLVREILRIDCTTKLPEVATEYHSFVLDLVSAHTGPYLVDCLLMIVDRLRPSLKLPPGVNEIDKKEENDLVFSRMHQLLQSISRIVPSTTIHLQPILSSKYPQYKVTSAYCQECYARNLLEISKYLPTIRGYILQLIVKQMIEFDTRAQRLDIMEVEENAYEEEDSTCDMFDGQNITVPRQMSHKEARTLDSLMNIMFSYLKERCFPNGVLDWEVTKKLYLDMVKTFEKLLLPTYASCHVQFLMFYICSFRTELAEEFLNFLWSRVESLNIEGIYRMAAAGYMGSFMARANYITIKTAKDRLTQMKEWIHRYIMNSADTSSKPDIRNHGPFYAVCQAFFYVIVFKHKSLLETHKGFKFFMSLNLQKIVSCRLNPLKFCLPAIASTFCSVVRNNQIAVCDTILERNRRSMLPEVCDMNGDQLNPTTVSAYFPFDPYLLTSSACFIKDLFQEYENIDLQENQPTDICPEEEADYMECEDDFEQHNFMQIPKSRADKQLAEFFVYSTSPGFQHV